MGAACSPPCQNASADESRFELARIASATAERLAAIEERLLLAESRIRVADLNAHLARDEHRASIHALTACVDGIGSGLDTCMHAVDGILAARDRQDKAVAQFGADTRRVVDAVDKMIAVRN